MQGPMRTRLKRRFDETLYDESEMKLNGNKRLLSEHMALEMGYLNLGDNQNEGEDVQPMDSSLKDAVLHTSQPIRPQRKGAVRTRSPVDTDRDDPPFLPISASRRARIRSPSSISRVTSPRVSPQSRLRRSSSHSDLALVLYRSPLDIIRERNQRDNHRSPSKKSVPDNIVSMNEEEEEFIVDDMMAVV